MVPVPAFCTGHQLVSQAIVVVATDTANIKTTYSPHTIAIVIAVAITATVATIFVTT